MIFRKSIFSAVLTASLAMSAGAKLRVAASTTFVGDVVAAIGGNAIELTVIYPRDADPHAYEPTPRDIAKIHGQQIFFENGLGLEESLRGPLKSLENENIETAVVSRGIAPHRIGTAEDPHVWTDPLCVMTWTTNIEIALSKLDPQNAASFRARAESYRKQLAELDASLRAQIEKIPQDRRILVTDHDELRYFADRYGLKIIGIVSPGFSTLAEPSARQISALEKIVRAEKAPAIFAGGEYPAALVRRVAEDTGIRLVQLPGCSLGPEKSATGTLLGYLQMTASKIIEGLRAP